MGRFLLSDRHGIFARFSSRKITWLGVICITELDLVTQHYPLPPPQPPPQQFQTHRLCVLPSPDHHHHPSPAYIKQQITKLTFPTALTLSSQFWAETLSNLPENKRRRGACGFECVCVYFACSACVCGQGDLHFLPLLLKKGKKEGEKTWVSVCVYTVCFCVSQAAADPCGLRQF